MFVDEFALGFAGDVTAGRDVQAAVPEGTRSHVIAAIPVSAPGHFYRIGRLRRRLAETLITTGKNRLFRLRTLWRSQR